MSAALTGLAVAFGGTALLVSPASRLLGPPDSMTTRYLEQAVLWLLFALVLAIVLFWEQQPLASLWLRPPSWTSLAWGLALAAAIFYVLNPLAIRVPRALGLGGFEGGMEKSAALPVGFRIFMCITAGIVEETLFRGYGVTRLAMLTGSLWLGVVLAVAGFSLLHLPVWGPGPVLAWFLGGLVVTAFFVWRQDLAAMMIAHAVVDLMGFVIVPSYSRWWEEG